MVCNKCGAQLPNDALFCNNCGANVASIPQQAQMQQAQPQMQQQAQPQMQQQYQPQMQQQYQPQMQYQYQQPMKPQIIQPKAKAGMNVGVVAAAMFFLGMLSSNIFGIDVLTLVPVMLLAGFVLWKEQDNWLRKCAVRAVGTVIIFSVLAILINIFFNFFDIIQIFTSWKTTPSFFYKLDDIQTILLYIVRGLQNVWLFIMAVRALGMKTTKMPIVDGIIDKHMK